MKTENKLSALWLVVILNLIFADVLSIFIELENGNTLEIIGEVKWTMAIAAVLANIPILMIYFSQIISNRIKKMTHTIAALITLIFVIGGGSWMPHYIICAGIEVLALLTILKMIFFRTKENITLKG